MIYQQNSWSELDEKIIFLGSKDRNSYSTITEIQNC